MNRRIYVGDINTQPIAQHLSASEIFELRGYDAEGNSRGTDECGKSILYHSPMIKRHKTRPGAYLALVEQSVILTALKREVRPRVPIAQGNFTIRRTSFANEHGAGNYFEHRLAVCATYGGQALPVVQPATLVATEPMKRAQVVAFPGKPTPRADHTEAKKAA